MQGEFDESAGKLRCNPYSVCRPLAATVRAVQHCTVETDKCSGCNRLLDLSIGRTSGLCHFGMSIHTICRSDLCCHSEGNELLGLPVQGSRGIHHSLVLFPVWL